MNMKRNYPLKPSLQALPPRQGVAWSEAPPKQVPLKRRLAQPPEFPSSRIDDLLGDFSEQTGANFG